MATVSKGKVIEVIKYWSSGLEFEIRLRLAKDRGTGAYVYAVWFDEWQKGVEGPEPGDVVRRAKALIDDKTSMTWEAFLFIRTEHANESGRSSEHPITAGNELSVSRCMVGTSAAGRKVHMFIEMHEEFDERTRARRHLNDGLPTVSVHEAFFGRGFESTALIPATPDNEAKARALIQALRSFGLRLVDLMGPEKAQESLGRVAMPTILEAPDESDQH